MQLSWNATMQTTRAREDENAKPRTPRATIDDASTATDGPLGGAHTTASFIVACRIERVEAFHARHLPRGDQFRHRRAAGGRVEYPPTAVSVGDVRAGNPRNSTHDRRPIRGDWKMTRLPASVGLVHLRRRHLRGDFSRDVHQPLDGVRSNLHRARFLGNVDGRVGIRAHVHVPIAARIKLGVAETLKEDALRQDALGSHQHRVVFLAAHSRDEARGDDAIGPRAHRHDDGVRANDVSVDDEADAGSFGVHGEGGDVADDVGSCRLLPRYASTRRGMDLGDGVVAQAGRDGADVGPLAARLVARFLDGRRPAAARPPRPATASHVSRRYDSGGVSPRFRRACERARERTHRGSVAPVQGEEAASLPGGGAPGPHLVVHGRPDPVVHREVVGDGRADDAGAGDEDVLRRVRRQTGGVGRGRHRASGRGGRRPTMRARTSGFDDRYAREKPKCAREGGHRGARECEKRHSSRARAPCAGNRRSNSRGRVERNCRRNRPI